jgi:hypothetical protein
MSFLPLVAVNRLEETYCQNRSKEKTTMGIVILLVILGAAFFVVGVGVSHLADFVRGDGATQRTHTPPRSHHLDDFDPRSRTA